jgi:ATP-dependent DNA ligase
LGHSDLLVVLPRFVPMIPAQVREPFHRDGWVHEEKVDGWRILAHRTAPASGS